MAEQIFKNVKLFLGGYDISGFSNDVAINETFEVKDRTTFGCNTRKRKIGLWDVTASFKGFTGYAQTADESHDAMKAVKGAEVPLTVCPALDGAVGEKAFFFNAAYPTYNRAGAAGEIQTFDGEAQNVGDGLCEGTVLANSHFEASGNGAAKNLGAVTATQKVYAVLHVLEIDAPTTVTVEIESDNAEGMADPTSRIAFTAKTARGFQYGVPVSGAITDNWWRAKVTVTGAGHATVVVAIAIQ